MPQNRNTLPGLSVCIVAFNEAANIGRTLDSVIGWAGEVVVVDCHSSDATASIARDAGAAVHLRPNIIPEATKNISFELATGEWILSLDADEVLSEELRTEIEQVIARSPQENGFRIPRRNFYFGVPLKHGGNYPDRQLRLFRRGRGKFPGLGYHERIVIDGDVGELIAPFDHHPYPTFDAWLRKFEFYTEYGAATLQRENVPITASTIRHHMITRPMRRWIERIFIKRGIRDGVPGVLAATFDLMTIVVSFGKYWDRSRRRDSGE